MRSCSWWSGDGDNIEGTQLELITSFNGLHQIINELTHILPSSSFIDLNFNNQLNMITGSGVHPLFHQNCHHKIIFAKVNMKIFYSPPYKHLVWKLSRRIFQLGKCFYIVKAFILKLPYLMKFFWTFLVTSYKTEQKLSVVVVLLGCLKILKIK